MFQKLGLGAIVTIDTRGATKNVGRLHKGVGSLRSGLKSLGWGADRVRRGLNELAMASAAVTVAIGYGAKKTMDFSYAMSGIGSVLLKSNADMKVLRGEALRLGAMTKFTASQAASGMEELARAGFNENQIIKASLPLLDAAAAENLNLAQAAKIVTSTLKSFGLEAEQAGRVADVLALISAKTSTNMALMGSGLTYVSGTAHALNIPLEETVAFMGMMADAGLRGTKGGTAFMNMLNKSAKHSKKATRYMREHHIAIKEARLASGKWGVDLPATMKSLTQGIMGIKKPLERVNVLSEIFGIRGGKAVTSFIAQVEKAPNRFEELVEQLRNADGTARKMADIRLDNVTGQITLMGSAVETLSIAFFGLFEGTMKGYLKGAVKRIQDLATVLLYLGTKPKDRSLELVKAFESINESTKSTGRSISEFALSVEEKFRNLKTSTFDPISNWWKSLGGDTQDALIKGALSFTMFMGVILPLVAPLALIGLLIGGLANIFAGLLTMAVPLGIGLFAIGAALGLVALNGDGSYKSLDEIWTTLKGLKTSFGEIKDAFLKGLGDKPFQPLIDGLSELYKAFTDPLRRMDNTTDKLQLIKEGAEGAGGAIRGLASVFGLITERIAALITVLDKGLLNPIFTALFDITGGIQSISKGNIREGLKGLGSGLLGAQMVPLKTAAVGYGEHKRITTEGAVHSLFMKNTKPTIDDFAAWNLFDKLTQSPNAQLTTLDRAEISISSAVNQLKETTDSINETYTGRPQYAGDRGFSIESKPNITIHDKVMIQFNDFIIEAIATRTRESTKIDNERKGLPDSSSVDQNQAEFDAFFGL